MKDPRRLATVVALVLLIAATGWYLLQGEDALIGLGGRGRDTDDRSVAFTSDQVPSVEPVVTDRLEGETFDRGRTNPFIYEKSREEREREEAAAAEARRKAAVNAELRRVEAEEKAARDAAAAAEAAARAAAAAANRPPPVPLAPQPPDFRYQYVGVIGPRTDALAILADGANKVSYARMGDTIDTAFRVERVGRLNLDISFTDPRFSGEVRQVQRVFKDSGAAGGSSRRPTSSRRN